MPHVQVTIGISILNRNNMPVAKTIVLSIGNCHPFCLSEHVEEDNKDVPHHETGCLCEEETSYIE